MMLRHQLINRRSIILFAAIFMLVLSFTTSIFGNQTVSAAAIKYTFKEEGTKIQASGGNLNGTTIFYQDSGASKIEKKLVYNASATIKTNPPGSTCLASLKIVIPTSSVGSKSSTGTLSASTQDSSSSPDSSKTPACKPIDLLNLSGSVTVSGSVTDKDKADNKDVPETDAQKEIIATVYYQGKTHPDGHFLLYTKGKEGTGKKDIKWTGSVGSNRWSKEPGQYTVCLQPTDKFKNEEGGCKTVTKKAKKTLQVNFGDPDKAWDKVHEGDEEEGEQATCKIDGGLGWILCPVFTLIGGISDAAYKVVALMLTVPPIMTNGDTQGVYSAWKGMRNVANVAFVIAFLIIIFSQVTSIGFSNYNIKKMVPRLVMAAILVNISFWICALAVDASNILGSSIKAVFDGMSEGIEVKNNGDFWSGNGPAFGAIVLAVISGTLIAATTDIFMLLAGLVPVLITVFVAILTVFVVLTARQAIIILLIVISPLAFVAILLPNTENWFTRWRQLFQVMLLMFPIIAAIFGASALAAIVIMNSTDNVAVQILGAGIAVVPLALTPVVMKTAGGMLNKIGAFVNNPNRGPLDKLRNRASDYQKRRGNISTAKKLGDNTALLKGSKKLSSSKSRFARGVGRTMGWAGSAAAYNAKFDENANQKNKYAQVYADAEARNYSNRMAVGDGGEQGIEAGGKYAMRVAAGNEDVARLVQAYGKQSVREEDAKDIKAERALLEFTDVSKLEELMDSKNSITAAAAAAEISSRGGGDKIQDALDKSAQIENENKRRLVQQQIISNMGPDEFGLGHGDKSALQTGTYGRDKDGNYDGRTYADRLAYRAETKMSGENIANLQPHDVAALQKLADNKQLSEGALTNVANAINSARSNENTNARIKADAQVSFDKILENHANGNFKQPQASAPAGGGTSNSQPAPTAPTVQPPKPVDPATLTIKHDYGNPPPASMPSQPIKVEHTYKNAPPASAPKESIAEKNARIRDINRNITGN